MYLNLYVPQLQRDLGVAGFIRYHLGQPVPSTVVVADRSRQFVRAVRRFCDRRGVPLISFKKGQRREDVAKEPSGPLPGPPCSAPSVGAAPIPDSPIPGSCAPRRWSITSTFYCVDADFGPFFLKFCSYF